MVKLKSLTLSSGEAFELQNSSVKKQIWPKLITR